ncbi:hypothetical protein [Streptomyces sp. NPDC059258]|uniref:hypothetical protein n=1 Tax=unclassified Streptomyces TaxID=2593676 RepID=UPI003690463C
METGMRVEHLTSVLEEEGDAWRGFCDQPHVTEQQWATVPVPSLEMAERLLSEHADRDHAAA